MSEEKKILSLVEETALSDLDRIIDHFEKFGGKPKQISVATRQLNALMRISRKAKRGVFRRSGRIEFDGEKYRGVHIIEKKKARKNYRQDATGDLLRDGDGAEAQK